MSKYILEGQLDFYAELYKSLDDTFVTSTDDNKCLITGQDLTDNFVTLGCGHKFNYIPLYYDIKNHKQKFNTMESISTHLKSTELRCPYCRQKHNELLPYYDALNLPKLHGVNHLIMHKLSSIADYTKKCEYIITNTNENVLHTQCYKMGTQINYFNGQLCGENYGDDKYYCILHKKLMIKEHKKFIANKEKQELKTLKKNAKMAAQTILNNLKQKHTVNVQYTEDSSLNKINSVIGLVGCNELLKTGPKKGQYCNCAVFNNNMCKRHYNIKCKTQHNTNNNIDNNIDNINNNINNINI